MLQELTGAEASAPQGADMGSNRAGWPGRPEAGAYGEPWGDARARHMDVVQAGARRRRVQPNFERVADFGRKVGIWHAAEGVKCEWSEFGSVGWKAGRLKRAEFGDRKDVKRD